MTLVLLCARTYLPLLHSDHALPRHYDEQVLALLAGASSNCQLAILNEVTADSSLIRKM